MRTLSRAIAMAASAALLSAALPAAAIASGITDQTYQGGKFSKGGKAHHAGRQHRDPFGGCPVSQRGLYYGDQYCFVPVRAQHAPRHPSCPQGYAGFYRGNIFCTEQR
ncbi:hypothetical protein [uncultured Roseobacter sp.]|uniref:hypothetical protein n=1 Tax=uncultured Roseobacter sp. TaxID=114847 RepID=UPI00260B2F17|nr:hypothetical protein [uncultured Roseobacter sp.]